MLRGRLSGSMSATASSSGLPSEIDPSNRKWSANCLEVILHGGMHNCVQLISVRLDHLDRKYSSILDLYKSNHKALDTKIEHIRSEVQMMETFLSKNDKLTEAYHKINQKFQETLCSVRSDALNWLNEVASTLDAHARQRLDNISFDANVMQEQRSLVKLDDMVERLRALHAGMLEELNDMIEKRQVAERSITQMISDEIEKLKDARNNYTTAKEEAKVSITKAVSDLKKELTEELSNMTRTREEFEDFVLETLERKMNEFNPNKINPMHS